MSNLPPPTSTASGETADPLASLHKMSRTAGAGTQEYVAINSTSVAALLLGLASALAIVTSVLLIIPAVAIFVASIALWQIRSSGGTQAGKGLAIAAIVLALAMVGFVGGSAVLALQREKAETQQIVQLMQGLGTDLGQRNYDAAWGKFSDRFKENIKRETFDTTWQQLQNSPYYGPVKDIRWNGVGMSLSSEGDMPFAQGVFIVQLQNGGDDRRMAMFRKLPDKGWVIDGIEGYFNPK
jgi:hypothetical protein